MCDLARVDEQTALPQRLDHRRGNLVRRQAGKVAEPRQHPTGFVDRHHDRQVVNARQLEVLRAAARGDVHDAGPFVRHDVVPRDDAVHDPHLRRKVVERTLVLEADELLASNHTLGRRVRLQLEQPPGAVDQPVLRIRLDRGGDVGRQRPGRRRPESE